VNGLTTQPGARPGDYLAECTRYRRVPGQGEFDLNGFLRAVLAIGTTAPVSVEVLSDVHDQLPPTAVAKTLAAASRQGPAGRRHRGTPAA
jgi:sugar phosphate isomerase/epimerase